MKKTGTLREIRESTDDELKGRLARLGSTRRPQDGA